MLDCIITNLVSLYTPDQLELNLMQCSKSDLEPYADLAHCNLYGDNIKSIKESLLIIASEMNERTMKIRPMHKAFKGDNYVDYNKQHPNDPIKTCIVVFDETSTLYEGCTGESTELKNDKSLINMLIRRIAQYGAALGVFLIVSLQRPTKDNLDPFIKSQSTVIISFRQNNAVSSSVAIDDPELALRLDQREFAYRFGSTISYGLVPWITSQDIKNNIQKYLIPGKSDYMLERRQKLRRDLLKDFESNPANKSGAKKSNADKIKLEMNKQIIEMYYEIEKENGGDIGEDINVIECKEVEDAPDTKDSSKTKAKKTTKSKSTKSKKTNDNSEVVVDLDIIKDLDVDRIKDTYRRY